MQQRDEAAESGTPAVTGACRDAARSSQRWTRDDRNRFFDHFAMSGDVARAAEAAGKTARSAYALRRRSGAFAEMWRAALDDAYERMEAALVRQVLGDADTTFDVGAALLLLQRRPAAIAGLGEIKARKVADRNSPRAKAERELLRRVEAMTKRSRAQAAE